jgi:GxxExxY protein
MEKQDPQTYAIIGAAMAVHSELGHGFLEPVYQEALSVQFELSKIPFQREAPIEIRYKGRVLDCQYKADFICFREVIVELKAVAQLEDAHYAQVINYLKATGFRRGLLINFGGPSLEWKRIVYGPQIPPIDTD